MTLRLNGSTSGYTEIDAPAVAGSNTIVLPSGNGSANQLLKNGSTAGSLEFSSSVYIDSSQRLLVGTSTSTPVNDFSETKIQVKGDYTNSISVINNENNGNYSGVVLAKVRSTSVVQSGDPFGTISFQGFDGTSYRAGAEISARVDGTPGTNDMPGRLVFSTTADGASSPTERARFTSGGYFKASPNTVYNGVGGNYHEFHNNTTSDPLLLLRVNNASYVDYAFTVGCYRTGSSAYSLAQFLSGDGSTNPFSDREFNLRGDGQAYADGSWNAGGADYAEYFEWSDGNPDEEDRRGISVVLDGDQIRPAVDGEDPIGVISGNPSVVGDAAWNKWSGKYLRDDYGTYIQEDYEVVNDEGETVIQQRRKLNPAYDPDQEYVSREDRPEWDCVGLMGKLRIRKGQPTGSRWIKMRDISDSVEEWLVR